MAIDVLSTNPMSAESERVFSGCRRTLSWDRATLPASNMEHIQCLKSWQKLCFQKVDIALEEAAEDEESEELAKSVPHEITKLAELCGLSSRLLRCCYGLLLCLWIRLKGYTWCDSSHICYCKQRCVLSKCVNVGLLIE